MRFAFISDIHSNLPALEAVMKEIKKSSIDQVIFLGDAVGYGPWPKECVSILSETVSTGVLGNHDAGVTGAIDVADYYDAVRYVIEWTRENLGEKEKEWLSSLNFIDLSPKYDWLISHGSPQKPMDFEYIFDVAKVRKLHSVKEYLRHINFSGHSHTMQVFLMTENNSAVEIDIESGVVDADIPYQMVCICGSVGQPRDRDKRAGFVIYDSEKKIITFKRVEYNVQLTVNKIKECKLPRSFANRLLEGC